MVKPKQRRVEEAKDALHLAEQSLAQKQKSLKKVAKRAQQIPLKPIDILKTNLLTTISLGCFMFIFIDDLFEQGDIFC